jgi:very-short-patch-repair endonuclease
MSSKRCINGVTKSKLCGDVKCDFCRSRSFASEKEKCQNWNYELNKGITPLDVFRRSGDKYLMTCKKHGKYPHNYMVSPNNIIRYKKLGCPFCSSKELCSNQDCESCFNKSLASSEYADRWSKENDKTAREVFLGSPGYGIFDCYVCGHEFEKIIANLKSSFCPYCSNNTFLCGSSECDWCYPKSFASHPASKKLCQKYEYINPYAIALGCHDSFPFECDCSDNDNFKHEYEQSINSITTHGKGCPYCCVPCHRLCGREDCHVCEPKSFYSNPRHKNLCDKTINPRLLHLHSGEKHDFECNKGHLFSMLLNSVSNGQWCPGCYKKTEEMVKEVLVSNFPDTKRERYLFMIVKKGKDEKIFGRFKFDFYIPSLKIAIEVDGRQHFEQVSNWTDPELTLFKDVYKMKLALINKITVIRILQEDVYYNRYDWMAELLIHIKKYEEPRVIYLGDTNIYRKHKKCCNSDSIEELCDKIKSFKI